MCFSCCPEFVNEPLSYIPRGAPFMNLLFALRITSAASLVQMLLEGNFPAMRLELEESRKKEVYQLQKFQEDAVSKQMLTHVLFLQDATGPAASAAAAAGGGGGGGGGGSGSGSGPPAASPGPGASWSGCTPLIMASVENARRSLQSQPNSNYVAAVFMIQFFAYVFYELDDLAVSEPWKSEFPEFFKEANTEKAAGGGGGGGGGGDGDDEAARGAAADAARLLKKRKEPEERMGPGGGEEEEEEKQ
jgi:hypothetical protein